MHESLNGIRFISPPQISEFGSHKFVPVFVQRCSSEVSCLWLVGSCGLVLCPRVSWIWFYSFCSFSTIFGRLVVRESFCKVLMSQVVSKAWKWEAWGAFQLNWLLRFSFDIFESTINWESGTTTPSSPFDHFLANSVISDNFFHERLVQLQASLSVQSIRSFTEFLSRG